MSEMLRRVAEAIRPYLEDSVTEPEGAARAAMETMREPTEAMRTAVRDIPTGNWVVAERYWRAMIDAALKP